MGKRQSTKAERLEEFLNSTYLVRSYVSKRDLGLIHNSIRNPNDSHDSDFYPKISKKDRHYNNGVIHAKNDLKLLYFFLDRMKPLYKNKILQSDEFQIVIKKIMDTSRYDSMTKEDRDQSLAFAIQMMSFCLEVMSRTMPVEFETPLVTCTRPLNDLLESIYTFMKNNNLKTLPAFRGISYPIAERNQTA